MKRILVIADDLTGAAEIAGIGYRHGLSTKLVRDVPIGSVAELTVIDTDSRLLSPDSAAARVEQMLMSTSGSKFDLIYKKTDSVLRGNIVAELGALLRLLNRDLGVLIAQNPSRGRTIHSGHYFIDGVPLHQTSFANDADRPVTTSNVDELLRPSANIQICDAQTTQDVIQRARAITGRELPAGGADFFVAILQVLGLRAVKTVVSRIISPKLFICGTASASKDAFIQRAIANASTIDIHPMPDSVYTGNVGDLACWVELVAASIERGRNALVHVPQPVSHDKPKQQKIQNLLAQLTSEVLSRTNLKSLFLEGGATASAVCKTMRWNDLQVSGEIESGVVVLNPSDARVSRIIVKPGSYPWPESVWA